LQYDIIVIGGGAAGLTSSGMAASFGMKTLMVELDRLGGDCTWHGCIPSKALLHIAADWHRGRLSSRFAYAESVQRLDYGKVVDEVHRIRKHVYEEADRPDIYTSMGVEVAFGRASFTDANTITITNGDTIRTVTSRYFVIATGSKAAIPPVVGIESVPFLTNESLFELTELPSKLLILGGGPIGCEMAQAFARLGSKVTVVDQANRILVRDDPKGADLLLGALKTEGIEFYLESTIEHVKSGQDSIECSIRTPQGSVVLHASHFLVAAGRQPNIKALDLSKAGVETVGGAVRVDDRCRTNVKHIYAAGDVSGRRAFTHVAEHMAKTAITNIAIRVPKRLEDKTIPWVTYTDPEIGSVGSSESELTERGVKFEVYEFPYSKVDRAQAEGGSIGLIRIFARSRDGKIYGASIVGKGAGEMLGELALAIRNGVSLRKIADTIHAYPTYALGVRRAADQWYVRKQSVGLVKLLQFLFRYRGQLPDLSDPNRIV
jgi:pyruvate/2-oxoglutarate dehydrogenase complex dihydrolipoamide dehydrogenase (E3) component